MQWSRPFRKPPVKTFLSVFASFSAETYIKSHKLPFSGAKKYFEIRCSSKFVQPAPQKLWAPLVRYGDEQKEGSKFVWFSFDKSCSLAHLTAPYYNHSAFFQVHFS